MLILRRFLPFLIPISVMSSPSRDSIFLNFGISDAKKNTYIDAGLGAPPIPLGSIRWINSVARRQSNMNLFSESKTAAITDYGFTSIVMIPMSSLNRLSIGVTLSARSEGTAPNFDPNAAFQSGFLNFSRSSEDYQGIKYSFGVAIPERSSSRIALPGIGIEYNGGPGDWYLQLRFPESQLLWITEDEDEWGISVAYSSKDYLLKTKKAANNQALYVENEKLQVAFINKTQLGAGVRINAKVAYAIINKLNLNNKNFDKISQISENKGFIFSAGLGWGF